MMLNMSKEVLNINPRIYEFDAVIQKNPDMDAAYVVFPYDIRKEFGKGRVKVDATFDGEPYKGSIVRMGSEEYLLGVLKSIRIKIGKQAGDTVHITVKERE